MYYKIIRDNKIIDAIETIDYVRYYKNIGLLRCSKDDEPQGIIAPDNEHIWHVDGWAEFPPESGWDDDTVTLEEFYDPELYAEIRETIDAGKDYSEFDPSSEQTEEIAAGPTPAERLKALENALAIMALEGRL